MLGLGSGCELRSSEMQHVRTLLNSFKLQRQFGRDSPSEFGQGFVTGQLSGAHFRVECALPSSSKPAKADLVEPSRGEIGIIA